MQIVLIFSASLIANLFFVRVLGDLRTQNLILDSQMTKIVAALCAVEVTLIVFFAHCALSVLFSLCFCAFMTFVLPTLIRHLRSKQFFKRQVGILDAIILRIKAGHSVRKALGETAEAQPPFVRSKLLTLLNIMSLDDQSREQHQLESGVERLAQALRLAERAPHRATKQLSQLRYELDVERKYKRKIGQALMQARAQSVLISMLYVALFVYVSKQFNLREQIHLVALSSALFLAGTAISIQLGRSWRWKV